MASFETHGIEDFQNELNKIENNLDDFVPFDELFNSEFMVKNTDYSSFTEFLKAGGFQIETQEDFDSIPSDKFNEHIKNTTKFNDWDEMLSTGFQNHLNDLM